MRKDRDNGNSEAKVSSAPKKRKQAPAKHAVVNKALVAEAVRPDPVSLVSSLVAKDFSGVVYYGTVTSRERVMSKSGTKDLGWHFHIKYDDGDEEDVLEKEVRARSREAAKN